MNYGLPIVAANIEDNPDNVTRFAVIGGETPPRTGKDKTALMFELAHRPGSLADAMAIFKTGGIEPDVDRVVSHARDEKGVPLLR